MIRANQHPRKRTLAALVANALKPKRRLASVTAHVAECVPCRRAVDAVREVAAELGDESARGAVAAWVDSYLSAVPDHRWPSLVADDERLHHVAVAQHLSRRADDLYYRDPRAGLMYAETVTAIHERIARRVSPEVRTAAWRDRAAFLLRCGRLGDAERSLDRAYQLAASADDPERERAILDLARAIAYSEPDVGRFDDAAKLLESCAVILADRGDGARAALARMRRGDIFMALSDYAPALGIFETLLPAADEPTRPRLLWRIASCRHEQGDSERAAELVATARVAFEQAGERVEIANADWLRGEILARLGRFDDALELLEKVEAEFQLLALLDVWVTVRLSRVAVILDGDPSRDVRRLCEEVARVSIALDNREPSRRHRCTADALRYLHENAKRNALTPSMVESIHAYVRRAAAGPVPKFTPPAGVALM